MPYSGSLKVHAFSLDVAKMGYVSTHLTFLSCVIPFNTLRPRQNGRHFADDIFKCIFFNENVWILNKTSLKYVPYGIIDNMQTLYASLCLNEFTHSDRDKMAATFQWTFQMHFLEWKCMNFDWKSLKNFAAIPLKPSNPPGWRIYASVSMDSYIYGFKIVDLFLSHAYL